MNAGIWVSKTFCYDKLCSCCDEILISSCESSNTAYELGDKHDASNYVVMIKKKKKKKKKKKNR